MLEVSELGDHCEQHRPGNGAHPFNERAIDDRGFREEQVQSIPLKRAARPEEIGRLAVSWPRRTPLTSPARRARWAHADGRSGRLMPAGRPARRLVAPRSRHGARPRREARMLSRADFTRVVRQWGWWSRGWESPSWRSASLPDRGRPYDGPLGRMTGTAPIPRQEPLGLSILLGLEVLVAGDIIRTVAVDPTFTSVGCRRSSSRSARSSRSLSRSKSTAAGRGSPRPAEAACRPDTGRRHRRIQGRAGATAWTCASCHQHLP